MGAVRTLAVLAVLTSLAACGSRPEGPPAPPAGALPSLDLHRSVYGPEVRDAEGRPYEHPFLGGLNVPRPQLVDIDADGDMDLFVQEASDELMFFERVAGGRLVWRTDRYEDLSIGEWYRFVDMDGDGDQDLLAEQPFSYVRYYRNDGTPGRASFVQAADTLRDADGAAIFSDRQNIPNATDIDCDGLQDLLVGRLVGTVTHYREVGRDAGQVPRFTLVTDRFENIEIVAQFGSLHGANTMALADVDGDGDQDFFWGDFFEAGLLQIENTGTCQAPNLRGQPVRFPPASPLRTSGYNAPAFGDTDADGDLDLLVGVLGGAFNPNTTTVDNLYELRQDGAGGFAVTTSRLLTQVDVGSESVPALVDLDDDGDLDLLLSNKIDPDNPNSGSLFRFVNEGSAQRPAFRLAGRLELPEAYHHAPAFGDLDGDGDLDMILGSWGDEIPLYRNDGSPSESRFVLADSAVVKLTRGRNATPALVDIDGDGDLDLFVGESSGELNFYRNAGTPRTPDFVLESDRFGGLDGGRRSAPAFVDVDGDGDLDLLLGTESEGLLVFRNDGTPGDPRFVAAGALPIRTTAFSVPALGDLDGDGDLDLLVGGIGGGLHFWENRAAGR